LYHGGVETSPAERKAILFSAGGVRLALRLSQVREILAAPGEGAEVISRGAAVPAVPVAVVLGLSAGPSAFALLTEASPVCALRVETLHGIVELSEAEVFQLPARTQLPQPAPFLGAIVASGEIALELAVSGLGWAPIEPAAESATPPPEMDPTSEPKLFFERAGRAYGVPVAILVQVLERPRVWRVPLAPAAHRGLLYHARTVHPVFDLASLYGDDPSAGEGGVCLLVDAGGAGVAVMADRVLGVGSSPPPGGAVHPAWDALFVA
jgi:chemotaxis signal transduction protein